MLNTFFCWNWNFSCLGVLLEPLHKLIFLHFSSLMAQGTAPEVGNLPPAIKWYLRFLRKCSSKVVGNGSQSTASTIKKSDIDFLFWPFLIPFSEIRASFTPLNQTSSKEVRDWSSRYEMKIKSWRNNLIEQLRSDLKVRYGSKCWASSLALTVETFSITRYYNQFSCSLK